MIMEPTSRLKLSSIGIRTDTTARFIMGLGLFYRQHPGEIQNLSVPIKVDYSAIGVSIAPGLRLRIDDNWEFEGKIELGKATGPN